MNPDIYKLLIIDDHPIVAEGIAAIASRQKNITCKSITCLKDLLSVIASEQFDMCITDLEFPDTNVPVHPYLTRQTTVMQNSDLYHA